MIFDYEDLARQLAINYFNVSIRPDKTSNQNRDECQMYLDKVFGCDNDKSIVDIEAAEYSRNVLIIGAGASKGQIDSVKDGNGAIEAIEKGLGFDDLLKKERKIITKYKSLASHYSKKIYGPNISVEKIQRSLGFEGRLSLLLNFYDKNDVLSQIKRILDVQHLPVRFYEIIAHMFKHRLIDIIINFNFDELLDNAIDDEMGPSSFFKIVHDSDCKPIEEIVDRNMLCTPVYIKPHGTISSKTSLLFTKEHYIDMSEDMKTLIYNLMMGTIGVKNRAIEKFNIMVAGFAMESIELNDILFTQTRKQQLRLGNRIKEINYYLFTDRNDEVAQHFRQEFDNWQKKLIADDQLIGAPNMNMNYSCKSVSLAEHFEAIYKKSVESIQPPFKPIDLYLHDILPILFPIDQIRIIGDELLNDNKQSYQQYLRSRCLVQLLYEFVKGRGRLAINVVSKERPGKYYKEYLNTLPENDRIQQPDLIGLLTDTLRIKDIGLVDGSDVIYEYRPFIQGLNSNTPKEVIADFVLEMSKKMVDFSIIKNLSTIDRDIRINDVQKVLESIYDSSIYEVGATHDDTKHARFRPFSKTQIMATSLSLTFKFFQYTILKGTDEWNEMYFASDSATPIYNLHRYCSLTGTSYLDNISSKSIKLLCSEKNKHVVVDNENGKSLNITNPKYVNVNAMLIEKFNHNLHAKYLNSIYNVHHMALFLKEDKPVFGFYFFKPDVKNRINPIFFEKNNGLNDPDNLEKLKELFLIQFKKGHDIFH